MRVRLLHRQCLLPHSSNCRRVMDAGAPFNKEVVPHGCACVCVCWGMGKNAAVVEHLSQVTPPS